MWWWSQRDNQRECGAPEGEADLAFLRSRADFDAEEMAGVRSRAAAAAPPPAAWSEATPRRLESPPTRPLANLADVTPEPPPRPRAERPPAGQPICLVIESRGEERRMLLESDLAIGRRDPELGTEPHLDLSGDDAVSRRHACLFLRDGEWWLQDLDSMNGTRLNGRWMPPGGQAPFRCGDEVRLGESSLIRAEPATRAAAAELDEEDVALAGLLEGLTPAGVYAAPEAAPASAGDVLDVALERGVELGMIPAPAPQGE